MNKKNYKPIGGQLFTLLLFWLVFTGLIVAALILFVMERKVVEYGGNWFGKHYDGIQNWLKDFNSGDAAKQATAALDLAKVKYPIIDFSLFSFMSIINPTAEDGTNWVDFWNNKQTNINAAYSYLFITAIIALVGVAMYLIMITKSVWIARQNKKMNLWSVEYDKVRLISNQIYVTFTLNLAIIFSFFNFLSTIIAGIYGIFLVLISLIFRKYRSLVLPAKWWTSPTFSLLITVVIYQNAYTLAKTMFLHYFSVNIDLIVQIIFPIGTTAVIITLFIKNMFSSNVSAVKAKMKNIITQAKSMDDFYEVREVEALQDYTFVTQLPVIFTSNIRILDKSGEEKLLVAIFKLVRQIMGTNLSATEQKYLMYHFFINIKTQEQLIELHNSIKLITKHKERKTAEKVAAPTSTPEVAK
jgi:hypothetical protein